MHTAGQASCPTRVLTCLFVRFLGYDTARTSVMASASTVAFRSQVALMATLSLPTGLRGGITWHGNRYKTARDERGARTGLRSTSCTREATDRLTVRLPVRVPLSHRKASEHVHPRALT